MLVDQNNIIVVEGAVYKKPPHLNGQFVRRTKDGNFNIEKIKVNTNKESVAKSHSEVETKELVNLGPYFPYVRTVSFFVHPDDYEGFIKEYPATSESYPRLTRDHNAIQGKSKSSGEYHPFKYDLYATSKPHPETQTRFVQSIMLFRSNPSGDRPSCVMHYELDDIYCIHRTAFMREQNMPIIRTMQFGSDSLLTCKISKDPVEKIEITWDNGDYSFGNGFDLHHILVKNNSSVRKVSEDPLKIATSYQLDLTEHQSKLIDIMGTVCLSKTVHAIVHANTPTQGIERYKNEWLPWVLQNNRNFDSFCNEYDLQLNYDEFYHMHTTYSLNDQNGDNN